MVAIIGLPKYGLQTFGVIVIYGQCFFFPLNHWSFLLSSSSHQFQWLWFRVVKFGFDEE